MNALGTRFCAALGCRRERQRSADGRVVYAFCWEHTRERLRAFAA